MASGTIASLRDRGFGFILPEGGSPHNDLFFHSTAVMDSTFDQLQVGQHVSFDEEPDPRDASRRRAVNVRVAGDAAAV